MALSQRFQPVRAMHFQHIALQHDIVLPAAQGNTVIGQHMGVVLGISAYFGLACILQPRLERVQNQLQWQLRRRAWVIVGQWDVSGLAYCYAQADTD